MLNTVNASNLTDNAFRKCYIFHPPIFRSATYSIFFSTIGIALGFSVFENSTMIPQNCVRKIGAIPFLLHMALFSSYAYAQTPPSYTLSTSNSLNVTFNGRVSIYAGQSLNPYGKQAMNLGYTAVLTFL